MTPDVSGAQIPAIWLSWAGTWDARFILAVRAAVDAAGIDWKDEAAVRKIMATLRRRN